MDGPAAHACTWAPHWKWFFSGVLSFCGSLRRCSPSSWGKRGALVGDTLAREHWNVQVVDSTRLGVVTSGPFRYVRIQICGGIRGDAGPSADSHSVDHRSGGAIVHIEFWRSGFPPRSALLFANPDFERMTGKPRFLPGLF